MKNLFVKIIFAFFFAQCCFSSCAAPPRPQEEFVLGTICRINLFEGGNNSLYSRIFSRIREIDRTMTAREDPFRRLLDNDAPVEKSGQANAAAETLVSGVLAINAAAGTKPVKVRTDLLDVLETALRYAELSGGAFDPTIGPVVALWGIGTENEHVPSADEIAATLELVNWRDLIIDRKGSTAFLRRKGMTLDLGAIAKGYAADEAVRIAGENRVDRALVDLGGNIAAMGWRDEKKQLLWRVGVQNPSKERGSYMGILEVHDKSIVTSGVYERYFEAEGTVYHHILSAKDGRPVRNGLLSVTIAADRSIDADALSTAVFALGYEKGKNLVDSIHGVQAIFIFDDNSVSITNNLKGLFTVTASEFTMH